MNSNNETKICPFCGEEIRNTAKKCKYCGEFLDKDYTQNKNKLISFIKNNSKKIIIVSIISFCCLSLVIGLLYAFTFFIQYEHDKEVIECFKNQFTITYPEINNTNLEFSNLTEINKSDTQVVYNITVSNEINTLTYSFFYNPENKVINGILAQIPSCNMLLNDNKNVNNIVKERIDRNVKNDYFIGMPDYKNNNEYISYELLSNAEGFEISKTSENKRNLTDLTCNSDFTFTMKKSEFKTFTVSTTLKFTQCKNDLDFCAELVSIDKIKPSYKTPNEYEAVKYNERNTKPYVRDYVTKALSKISFVYPYPDKDLSGQYAINIAKNGHLLSVMIIKEMNDSYYDSLILEALTKCKYPPLPDKYPDKMISIKLIINLPAKKENSYYYENNNSDELY